MTLMAGPIDCRVNPTKVNELATEQADRVVRAEPDRDRAAALSGRVPPRLSGLRAARRLHEHEHRAPREGAPRALRRSRRRASSRRRPITKAFYDEYFAVLDLTAEFYLETVRIVFQELRARRRHAEIPRRAGRPARDPPHRAVHRGRRAATTSARSGRRLPRTSCARASAPTASATTCSPASATTACSPGKSGKGRFIRC